MNLCFFKCFCFKALIYRLIPKAKSHRLVQSKWTPSGSGKSVRNWSWRLTGMCKYRVCMSQNSNGLCPTVKAASSGAVRLLRQCPLIELRLYFVQKALRVGLYPYPTEVPVSPQFPQVFLFALLSITLVESPPPLFFWFFILKMTYFNIDPHPAYQASRKVDTKVSVGGQVRYLTIMESILKLVVPAKRKQCAGSRGRM